MRRGHLKPPADEEWGQLTDRARMSIGRRQSSETELHTLTFITPPTKGKSGEGRSLKHVLPCRSHDLYGGERK